MKNSLIVCLVSIFVLSYSANSYSEAGWSGEATVVGIYSVDENRSLIKLSNFANPHNCSIISGGDVIVNPTTQKSAFSMFLSAYMSGKPVNVYVKANCTTIWPNTSFADLHHVRLL